MSFFGNFDIDLQAAGFFDERLYLRDWVDSSIVISDVNTTLEVPYTISGCVWWTRSDLGTTTVAGKVTTWADQSGAAILSNVVQASSSQQPSFTRGGGVNGLPYLTGLDNTVAMTNAANILTAGNDRTVFVVYKGTTTTGGSLMSFASASPYICFSAYLASNTYTATSSNTTSEVIAGKPDTSNLCIETITSHQADSRTVIRINGVNQVVSSTAPPSETGTAGFSLFSCPTVSQGFVGDIYETIIYNRILSSSEITTVENYLNTRYNQSSMSSYDTVVKARAAGQKTDTPFAILVSNTPGNTWARTWKNVGVIDASFSTSNGVAEPASTPGTSYTSSVGSFKFPSVSPAKRFISSIGVTTSRNAVQFMIFDRLVGVGGISLTGTGNQTINSVVLPRYANAASASVQCWLEVTTSTSVTAPIVNLSSYTSNTAVASQSGGSVTFPLAATLLNSFIGPMYLAAGDYGLRSVEVGLNVGTASTTGVVNLILIRPLAVVTVNTLNEYNEVDLVSQFTALPRVFDGASLGIAVYGANVSINQLRGIIRTVYN